MYNKDALRRLPSLIADLEATHRIRVLVAVESGSRAWGFASPDSDFDVRFLYCHAPTWYVALDEGPDTLDFPVAPDGLDLSGWELRKTLRLLRAGNATPAEWLQSPTVYHEAWPGLLPTLRALLAPAFKPRAALHHYLGLAKRGLPNDAATDGDPALVRLKPLCYALRAALACRWVRQRGTVPPMAFGELRAELPPALVTATDELLRRKTNAVESAVAPVPPALMHFLAAEVAAGLAALPLFPQPIAAPGTLTAQLDTTLRELLAQARNT